MPACPSTPNAGVATTVVLFGAIATDGSIQRLDLVPGATGTEAPQEFVQSAIETVRQWRYTPALLDGQPVVINVTVRISYTSR